MNKSNEQVDDNEKWIRFTCKHTIDDIKYFAEQIDLYKDKAKLKSLKQLQIMLEAFDIYISEQIKQIESL